MRNLPFVLSVPAVFFIFLSLPWVATADEGEPLDESDLERLADAIASTTKPAYPQLDSHLNKLVEQSGPVTSQRTAPAGPLYHTDWVAVTIRLTDNVSTTVDMLEQSGALVANVGPDYIESYVPVSLLTTLAEADSVLRVETIVRPHPLVIFEGTTAHGSPTWNDRGYTGSGVKVGVIDVGFIGYSDRIAEGELPSAVGARCYTAVGSFTSDLADCEAVDVHGTAVAETVIDVAPDVDLYIANPLSPGDLQAVGSWMVSQGVDVINMSLSWTWDGPGDGTSPYGVSPVNTVSSAVAGGAI